MRAHPSNYRIMGFTSEAEIAELAGLAREYELVLLDDLGSGVYIDLSSHGLAYEPTVNRSLEEGADLVCFSGDKLLGGPQGGIILGRSDLVESLARHPLARALRLDKLSIAALEATLRLYLDPQRAIREIPTLAMLTADPETLRKRARSLARKITAEGDFEADVVEDASRAGGGALPMEDLPTWAVAVTSATYSANRIETGLREAETPVICRIREDRVILDVRTIADDEISLVAEAFRSVSGTHARAEEE
jgi:L-seryl-tRNA(Ser) seleniumtransferase